MKFKNVLAKICSFLVFSSSLFGSVPANAMQESEEISFGGDNKCNVVFISEDQNIDPSAFIKAIADKDENEDEDTYTYTYTKQFDDGSSIRLNLSSNESDLDSADMVCMCVNGQHSAKDQPQNIENQTKEMLEKIPENKPYCLVSVTGHVYQGKPLGRVEHNLEGAESLLSEGTFVWKYGTCQDVGKLNLCDHLANILRENLIQQEKWSEKYILGQNAVSAMSNVQKVYFEPINILFIPTYNELNPYKVIESLGESFRNLYGADINKLDDNTLEVKVVAQNASAKKQAEFVFNLHGESSAFKGLTEKTENTDAAVLYCSADSCANNSYDQGEKMRNIMNQLNRNGIQLPSYIYITGLDAVRQGGLRSSIDSFVLIREGYKQFDRTRDVTDLKDEYDNINNLPRRLVNAIVHLASQAIKRVDVDVVLPLVDDNDNSFEGLEFSSTPPGWWDGRSKVEKGLIISGSSALAVSVISGIISAFKKQFNKPKCDKQKVSRLSKNSRVKA